MSGSAKAVIFVEGPDDLNFVRQYLQHLGFGEMLFDGEPKSPGAAGRIIIRPTYGIGIWMQKKIPQDIIDLIDISDRVLIVVDANADIQKRQKEMDAAAAKVKAQTDADARIFLMPDDEKAGALECLLIAIFRDGGVAECFGRYKECMHGKNLPSPDAKGQIYAYCEAHKVETDAVKRDYDDPAIWDLEHPDLLPLRKFLTDNLPPCDGGDA